MIWSVVMRSLLFCGGHLSLVIAVAANSIGQRDELLLPVVRIVIRLIF